MKVEKVRVKKHLKAGPKEYPIGVYSSPIPEDILSMISRPGVVEILEVAQPPIPKKPLSAPSAFLKQPVVEEVKKQEVEEKVEVKVEIPHPEEKTVVATRRSRKGIKRDSG